MRERCARAALVGAVLVFWRVGADGRVENVDV